MKKTLISSLFLIQLFLSCSSHDSEFMIFEPIEGKVELDPDYLEEINNPLFFMKGTKDLSSYKSNIWFPGPFVIREKPIIFKEDLGTDFEGLELRPLFENKDLIDY